MGPGIPRLNESIQNQFNIFKVNTSTSIFSLTDPEYTPKFYLQFDQTGLFLKEGESFTEPWTLQYTLKQQAQQRSYSTYIVTPRQLISAASQIGGLMSFLGIFLLIMRVIHRREVNRQIKKMHPEIQYSYEEYAEVVKRQKDCESMVREQGVELAEMKSGGRSRGINLTECNETEQWLK
ncbi:hypothetical protein FGO68_gene10247 [Halteria grandinella]|uniref:Uncharacterized protein n=1 Tax=Halteria grandinella TaxID=5974 RepID=A0A8J8NQ65_HALGN|nr:hypothetical protein FGO68_gene10247 [Halteria grandinella]